MTAIQELSCFGCQCWIPAESARLFFWCFFFLSRAAFSTTSLQGIRALLWCIWSASIPRCELWDYGTACRRGMNWTAASSEIPADRNEMQWWDWSETGWALPRCQEVECKAVTDKPPPRHTTIPLKNINDDKREENGLIHTNEDGGVNCKRAAQPEGVCSPRVTSERPSTTWFMIGTVGQIFG